MSPIDLSGKKGVVFGVANQRSIAWSIADALAEAGAELAFTFLGERLKAGVEKTISALGDPLLIECDATDDAQVKDVYDQAAARLGKIDIVVHCIAFAARDDLGGDFSVTGREGFSLVRVRKEDGRENVLLNIKSLAPNLLNGVQS